MTMVDLSGRVALVTGASRGIGRAVALAYAKAGAHVVLAARTVGALEAVDDEIQAAGGSATIMPVDMRALDKLDALGPALAEKFGRLDIFVGNAGMLGTLTPLGHMTAKDWDNVMMVNLTANFRLIRTLDPLLRASDAGRAIFTGTRMVNVPTAYWGAYTVSKAALDMLVKTYAAETATTNVRVNLVDPGTVDTAMLKDAFPGGYAGKTVQPEDLVETYLTLAAPDCAQHGKMLKAAA
ncbi:MAG: SDR family NAD(P)-dependent oxidoreductase [Alphaproteobacteria bacterium]|nr:SDR family NAD(P)-dependent oxidoreductase [Alphaproteobacteria bacterium]